MRGRSANTKGELNCGDDSQRMLILSNRTARGGHPSQQSLRNASLCATGYRRCRYHTGRVCRTLELSQYHMTPRKTHIGCVYARVSSLEAHRLAVSPQDHRILIHLRPRRHPQLRFLGRLLKRVGCGWTRTTRKVPLCRTGPWTTLYDFLAGILNNAVWGIIHMRAVH